MKGETSHLLSKLLCIISYVTGKVGGELAIVGLSYIPFPLSPGNHAKEPVLLLFACDHNKYEG